jgi:parallel beta-helix repeat protein
MKMNLTGFFAACFTLLFAVRGAWAEGPTYVQNDITLSTEWTLDNSPYVIQNEVTVSFGAVLTIDPGVEVRFTALRADNAGMGPRLVIRGALKAIASRQTPISFDSSLLGGHWGGVDFLNCDSAHSILVECRITGGRISCNGSSPTISRCSITRCEWGIDVSANSRPRIRGNRIDGNRYGLALTADTASPLVQKNEIVGNDYGVYLKAFKAPILTHNRIFNNLKYNLVNSSTQALDIPNNDFNTADARQIAKGIYDGACDPALGRLNYIPFTVPSAPSGGPSASTNQPAGAFTPQVSLNLGLSEANLFTPAWYPSNGQIFASRGQSISSGTGASFFLDYRLLQFISLGLGASYTIFPGMNSWSLSTFDLGGRLFPLEASSLGEFYLLGGLGMNLSVRTLDHALPGHYHGFAGLGYRFTVDSSDALEVGAQYDYFSPYAEPLDEVSLKVGWTFFFNN